MDNFNTGTPKKSSILEQMKIMEGIVKSLDAAGVNIIHLQVGKPADCYILLHIWGDAFRRWADVLKLDVIVEPLERKDETEKDYGLRWMVDTVVNGISVHGYLTDYQKEEWDNAAV